MPIIGTTAEVNRHAAAMDAFGAELGRLDALFDTLDNDSDIPAVEAAAEALKAGVDALLASYERRSAPMRVAA